MARLTIEDCWWTDPRRELLAEKTGDLSVADVVAVKAWRLAQEFWKRGRGLVPRPLFEALKHAESLVAVGLAELRGEAVYVRGSGDYLDWLNERLEAASAGGKVSAQRERDAQGRLMPKETPSNDQAKTKQTQASSSSSSSSSSSFSKERKNTVASATSPLLEIWNQNRGTLPLARECLSSSKRGRAAAVRWREHPDAAYWTEVVRRLAASPFCRGETDRGTWRASFDFLVQPDTHIKALEGKYDPPRARAINTTPTNLEAL